MAIRVGYQQRAASLSLPQLAIGSSAFISAAAERGEATQMAHLLGSSIAQRMHELYTLPVDDVSRDFT